MASTLVKPKETLNEFLGLFKTDPNNPHDVPYLKARYNWEHNLGTWQEANELYAGTSFQLKHEPNWPKRKKAKP